MMIKKERRLELRNGSLLRTNSCVKLTMIYRDGQYSILLTSHYPSVKLHIDDPIFSEADPGTK